MLLIGLSSFSQKNLKFTVMSTSKEYNISKGNSSTLEQLDTVSNSSVPAASSIVI